MGKPSVLVVDDHPIITEALLLALSNQDFFAKIETANSLLEAQKILDSEKLDLLILDLHMSDAQGVHAMISMREKYPDIPVIIYSGEDSEATINKAFECGVRGYVPKSYKVSIVLNAIELVLSGESYIPNKLIKHLGFDNSNEIFSSSGFDEIAKQFTPRQNQVFEYLLQGMPNRIIAARLEIAENTVKTHLNTIYRIIGVNSRAQAILKAQQLGYRKISSQYAP